MADNNLPEEVKSVLAEFESKLSGLEKHLQPILDLPARKITDQLTPLERAQLHVTLAYSANSLFCMYLKTQGVSPEDHPVRSDLERVRLYMEKVDQAVQSKAQGPRPTQVDVAAANRAFLHALPQLTAEQKSKLRAQSKQAKAQGSTSKGDDRAAEGTEQMSASQIADRFLSFMEKTDGTSKHADDDNDEQGDDAAQTVGEKRKKKSEGGATGSTPGKAAAGSKTPGSEKKKKKKKNRD